MHGRSVQLHRRAVVLMAHQWRKALRRNMAVNCSLTRLNMSWMAVVLPRNVALIFRPLGGMSQICRMGQQLMNTCVAAKTSLTACTLCASDCRGCEGHGRAC